MNYNQHFDEHIKDQFSDYSPQVHPRIWENIARDREKKRPVGFWLNLLNRRTMLVLAGLLLAGGTTFFILNKTDQAQPLPQAAPTPVTQNTAGNTVPTTATTNTSALPEAAGTSSTVSSNNNPQVAATSATTGASTATTLPVSNTVNRAAVANTVVSATDQAAAPPVFYKKQTGSSVRQKIKITNGTATDDAGNAAADEETTAPVFLQPLLFTAQKNNTNLTAVTLAKRVTANVKDPGCPTIEKNAAGNKTYIEIYGGPDLAFRSMSDTGNSVYLQKRKESTTFSSAFSAGLRYTRVFNNGVSIRTGINYSQINEKFTFSEGNIVQVVYIINAAGDTIGSYTTTGSRYKTTFNKFKTLDIPVVLGYELGNGNLHTNINAGIIVNAYSWQKGEVLGANLQPVDITTGKSSSPYQFKTNIGVGFIGSVSLYYKLNERWHLLAEPYFRYNLTPASKEIITFKQKYNTAGLRLGLRMDL